MSTLSQMLAELRAYSAAFKDKAGYYLDHSRWHAQHPSGHADPTIWFHGTTSDFNRFRERSPGTGGVTSHWNNYLGAAHFAHNPETASDFAGGLYQQTIAEMDSDAKVPGGRVIAARLHMQNPRHFESEDALNAYAAAAAIHSDLIPTSHVQEVAGDLKYNEPEAYAHLPEHLQKWGSSRDWDDWLFEGDHRDLADHPFMQVAGSHIIQHAGDDAAMLAEYESGEENDDGDGNSAAGMAAKEAVYHEIGANARRHLQDEGHDGVTYSNAQEGGIGAVPFRLEQIHEAYGHGDHTRRFSVVLDALRSYAAPGLVQLAGERHSPVTGKVIPVHYWGREGASVGYRQQAGDNAAHKATHALLEAKQPEYHSTLDYGARQGPAQITVHPGHLLDFVAASEAAGWKTQDHLDNHLRAHGAQTDWGRVHAQLRGASDKMAALAMQTVDHPLLKDAVEGAMDSRRSGASPYEALPSELARLHALSQVVAHHGNVPPQAAAALSGPQMVQVRVGASAQYPQNVGMTYFLPKSNLVGVGWPEGGEHVLGGIGIGRSLSNGLLRVSSPHPATAFLTNPGSTRLRESSPGLTSRLEVLPHGQ